MSDIESPGTARKPFHIRAQQLEKLPPCQARCPNSGDVRGWLGIIAQHEKNGLTLEEAYDRAWEHLVERNPLPATIGRICPHPCEDLCTRRDKDGAVSINAMERFLGDWAISRDLPLPRIRSTACTESVGVVGSGPASLSFAYQMARRGYPVTIYEEHGEPGGMLRQAIPDYRLPRTVLEAELRRVLALDIELVTGVVVGADVTLRALREKHDLVFLGLGAQAARRLGIPGEDGPGVIPGIGYLERRKAGDVSQCGARVIVVGGGNTAIDAARSARRDGAEVTLLYRRSEAEMPAARQEIVDARSEGVEFRFLAGPARILRDGASISGVEIQDMRLGEPDDEGRRRPLPIPGQLHALAADTVIVAVSQAPAWHGIGTPGAPGGWLRTADDGRLDADVWAGGDDRGPGIASKAIAQGRLAAESADAELRGRPAAGPQPPPVTPGSVKTDYYAARQRTRTRRRPEREWLRDPEREIDETISSEQACAEAARCMSCGLCFDCRQCFMYCNASGFTRVAETAPGKYFVLALDACEGCGKCIEICPSGYLEPRDAPH
jgi:NADPH-dependent glutamate synthase beta subunit-like oxidoreductase